MDIQLHIMKLMIMQKISSKLNSKRMYLKTCTLLVLLISIKLNAQQESIYENKALVYFTKNINKFVKQEPYIVYIDTNISHSFDSSEFLEYEHWQNKGIVAKKSYSRNDSELNSLRKEVYSISIKSLIGENNTIRNKSKNIICFDKNIICLDIFKHFFYGGYVYVYIQVKRDSGDGLEYRSALLKFDYNLELIDTLLDCFVT